MENFGSAQARSYAETLSITLNALSADPTIIRVQEWPEIANNIRTFHVARDGCKGRRFMTFRIGSIPAERRH